MSNQEQSTKRKWVSLALWILAVGIMFAAAGYQEGTGPTKEFRGSFTHRGESVAYGLVRSGNTDAEAPVLLPDPGGRTAAGRSETSWKRLPGGWRDGSVRFPGRSRSISFGRF